MTWEMNITELNAEGTFRSLNGAADENIFIGKASKAGFFCFFKVWRDMPYDAVLDYNGILYRVEVKGSRTTSFNLTRGGRSGAQIDRTADDRTRLIDRNDCDFVVCVDSNNGDCYIIPVDYIQVLHRPNLSKNNLQPFNEKWNLFMGGNLPLSLNQTRDGLMELTIDELREIANTLRVTIPREIRPIGTKNLLITEERDILIMLIWVKVAEG